MFESQPEPGLGTERTSGWATGQRTTRQLEAICAPSPLSQHGLLPPPPPHISPSKPYTPSFARSQHSCAPLLSSLPHSAQDNNFFSFLIPFSLVTSLLSSFPTLPAPVRVFPSLACQSDGFFCVSSKPLLLERLPWTSHSEGFPGASSDQLVSP